MSDAAVFSTLIRKFRQLAPIDDADIGAIEALPFEVAQLPARHYLVRDGDEPGRCCLLVGGYAARNKVARDGGRQIVSFHVAGDLLDIQHLWLARADHNIQTITAATVAWVPMAALRALIAERPTVGIALWRDALVDASIFREWVLNVGRRDARTRIAHMLCEFIARSAAAGLGSPQRMQLPFSQEEIGDATGLTPVHVNRMLRQLTEEGLIKRSGRFIEVQDWEGFRRAAGFDAAYLHAAA